MSDQQLIENMAMLETENARLRDECKAAIADKLIANIRAVELEAALEQIKELETLDDGELSTSGEIAREALAKEETK